VHRELFFQQIDFTIPVSNLLWSTWSTRS